MSSMGENTGGSPVHERDIDYWQLETEAGCLRGGGMPVWRSRAGAICFDGGATVERVERVELPEVPGAFLLRGVLSRSECEQIRRLSDCMGYRLHSRRLPRASRSGATHNASGLLTTRSGSPSGSASPASCRR